MQSKSTQNHKIQTRPIEDLLGRIRTLRQQGQKQIIIPAKEADQLADSLSQVMTRMVTIQEEIIDASLSDDESGVGAKLGPGRAPSAAGRAQPARAPATG